MTTSKLYDYRELAVVKSDNYPNDIKQLYVCIIIILLFPNEVKGLRLHKVSWGQKA